MIPWARILIGGAIVAVAVTACMGRDKSIRQQERELVEAKYEKQLTELREAARKALDVERARTREVETRLANALQAQEKKDAFNKTQVQDLQRRLDAAVARNAGRLRDPNGCGASSRTERAPAPAAEHRDADRAEAGGLLSAQLTGLLRRLQREADEVNNAYASCRADLLRRWKEQR